MIGGVSGSLSGGFLEGSILVFEDNYSDQRQIEEGLREAGIEQLVIAENMEDFDRALRSRHFDVVSIDWDINGRYLGSRALRSVRQYQAGAARIVYSVNSRSVRSQAIREGANAVVEKLADIHSTDYVDTVRQGMRVSMAREICERLREYAENVPSIGEGLGVDDTTEAILRERGRSVAINVSLSGRVDNGLIVALKKRGWWKVFEGHFYAKLGWREKLLFLTEAAGFSRSDLAAIFGIRGQNLEDILSGQDPDEAGFRAFDNLISVLFYFLRLTSYEPDLLSAYCERKGLFGASLELPPWDEHGLREFLKLSGVVGIQDCLRWVRSC